MIFNRDKFVFAESTVQYLGFQISDSGISPTQEYTQVILDFPTPCNITDVRSWFGMVGQVSYAFNATPEMAPFRHLLSTKVPFAWSPELDAAFHLSKKEVVRQCELGVHTFDPNLPTALACNWSKLACGFWLCQKHCHCQQERPTPGCCKTGWQTVFCGTKFNSPSESR